MNEGISQCLLDKTRERERERVALTCSSHCNWICEEQFPNQLSNLKMTLDAPSLILASVALFRNVNLDPTSNQLRHTNNILNIRDVKKILQAIKEMNLPYYIK